MKKVSVIARAFLALPFLLCGAATGEQFRSKPVVIVVPFVASGPTDTVARIIATAMAENLSQPVIVQNVGGAGGTIGSNVVSRSAPDGYTILLHNIGMATAPSLYQRLPFDPLHDFEPVGLVASVPMTLIGRPNFPAADLSGLVDLLRRNGEAYTLAHAGIGSASHLCGVLLMEAISTRLTTVAYNGSGPAMSDVTSGQIDLICDQTTNTVPVIRQGLVKAYAVTSSQRSAALPELETSGEAGLPQLAITSWHGLYAPRNTPDEIITRLQDALRAAVANGDVLQQMTALGAQLPEQQSVTGVALKQKLSEQIGVWRPIIRDAELYAN